MAKVQGRLGCPRKAGPEPLGRWGLPGAVALGPSSGARPAETRLCEGFHVQAAFTFGVES